VVCGRRDAGKRKKSLCEKKKKKKKKGKIVPEPPNIVFNPPETLRQKNKKIQKNNHVSLCSTRDPTHIHTVINRFRAIASPPRGHRRQAQRSCPPRERPPEGIRDIFFCALVFCIFLFFWRRVSGGLKTMLGGCGIILPKKKEKTLSSSSHSSQTLRHRGRVWGLFSSRLVK